MAMKLQYSALKNFLNIDFRISDLIDQFYLFSQGQLSWWNTEAEYLNFYWEGPVTAKSCIRNWI